MKTAIGELSIVEPTHTGGALGTKGDRGITTAEGVIIGELWEECPDQYCNKHLMNAAVNAERLIRAWNCHDDLLEALEGMTRLYVALAESGDAGFWDAEKEPEVIASRAAISKAKQ